MDLMKILFPKAALKNPKGETPPSRWITGKEIIDRWGLSESEFFVFILKDLQSQSSWAQKFVDSLSLEKAAFRYIKKFLIQQFKIEDVLSYERKNNKGIQKQQPPKNSDQATPPSRWITGKEIINRWGLSEFEFIGLILQDLKTHPREAQQIVESDSIEKAAFHYGENFLVRTLEIEEVLKLEHKNKINFKEQQIKTARNDSKEVTPASRWIPNKEIIDRLVYLEFEFLFFTLHYLQVYRNKVKKIVDYDSPEKATPPSKWISGRGIIDRWGLSEFDFYVCILRFLQDSYKKILDSFSLKKMAFLYTKNFLVLIFKTEYVLSFEHKDNKISKEQQQVKPTQPMEEFSQEAKEFNNVDHEQFIRSLRVSYINDTEISIREKGKRRKEYEKKELGFKKENSKTWNAFINILQIPDHTYYTGAAHGANRIRRHSYDVSQKILSEISNKFLSFFSDTYQIQFPEKFKLFERIIDERPGTYRLKFQIVKYEESEEEQFIDFSKNKLLEKIKALSTQFKELSELSYNCGDEEAENKSEIIFDKLYSAIEIAEKKGWLTPNRAKYYLSPEEPSDLDF